MKYTPTERASVCGTETRIRPAMIFLLAALTILSLPSLYFGVKAAMGVGMESILVQELHSGQSPQSFTTLEEKDRNTALQQQEPKKDTRPLVAIVVCTKSLPNWGQNISSTGLHTLLIPSIERTVTIYELRHYRVEFVIGFDKGDVFWENELNRKALGNDTTIPLNFVSIVKNPDRPHHIPFNQACRAAYEYGADYIARVNDDTEFVTSDWIRKGIEELAKFHPPNVGVVGPIFKDGNTEILTHDFVHRTHLDIFNDYYPDEFDNWWIDDWITVVYRRTGRCKKMTDWRVKHHIMLHGGGNSRYKITHTQKKLLETTLQRGMKSIDLFVHNQTGEHIEPVLGTNKIDKVWGPMAPFHHRNVEK